MKLSKPLVYGLCLSAAFLFALAATLLGGAPSRLPDTALSSTVLLHVERTAVILAAAFVVFVILARAWEGKLPSELSRDGAKWDAVSSETVEDARDAADLKVSTPGDKVETFDDSEGEGVVSDVLTLRLKLEAKMAFISKSLLRPLGCEHATVATIGSLNYDGFLTDEEARVASQILTLRDEELDTLDSGVRRGLLRNADKVVRNLRASVFHGLVRVTLKRNKWNVTELSLGRERRPDLLASKDGESYRIAVRFAMADESELPNKALARLAQSRDQVPESALDIVVIPDRSRYPATAAANQAVMKFPELKDKLSLVIDPRVLPAS